jgi:hypothetical protein
MLAFYVVSSLCFLLVVVLVYVFSPQIFRSILNGVIMTTTIAAVLFTVFVVCAMWSTEARVQSTVCPQLSWVTGAPNVCFYDRMPLPDITPFVVRDDLVASVVGSVEEGAHFVILDGANGMGKSFAAEVAAAHLSKSHAVKFTWCTATDTSNSVLVKLLLPHNLMLERFLSLLPAPFRLSFPPPSSAELTEALLKQPGFRGYEPVFIVEMAERLSLFDLRTLIDLAKVLADKRRGRFVFVFSPSSKLAEITGFGSMSRASIVSVGDLTETQALDFLRQLNCNERDAKSVHLLIDGHLPYLVDSAVSSFCHSKLSLDGLKAYFTALVRSIFKHADVELNCKNGCACKAACAIRDEEWDHTGLTSACTLLLKEKLVRASLKEKIYKIDSRFVLCYLERECACNNTGFVVVPSCTFS